ncbi:MAG: sodium:phosphate symporter, partial [Halanaeroarchaeum sp.]
MTESEETAASVPLLSTLRDRVREAGPLWAGALGVIIVYLFAIQLLGAATEGAEPLLRQILRRVVVDDGSALGLSWLVTYGLTNGSVVAALALSLFGSDIVSVTEVFLIINGSRLGGAGIIVLVGVFDYLQNRGKQTLLEGTSLGLLTFLVSISVYVPVTLLGLVILRIHPVELFSATAALELPIESLQYFDPVTEAVARALGPRLAFGVAIVILFGTLWLFDQLLERVETETVRQYVFHHFERRWMAFVIGVVITGITTSVAFSLGVVVPLYNRKFVRREEIV